MGRTQASLFKKISCADSDMSEWLKTTALCKHISHDLFAALS